MHCERSGLSGIARFCRRILGRPAQKNSALDISQRERVMALEQPTMCWVTFARWRSFHSPPTYSGRVITSLVVTPHSQAKLRVSKFLNLG